MVPRLIPYTRIAAPLDICFLSAEQEKVIPTVVAGWKLWIPAHAINFGFVPSSQRVLYVNVVAVSASSKTTESNWE